MKRSLLLIAAALLAAGCHGNADGTITASGAIEATEVTVTAKLGGEITALAVAEGAEVKKGDQLAAIDRENLEIQLRQAQANVQAAAAQYRLAKRGPRDEDIRQAEANHAFARDEFNRAQELFRLQSATQKQLDDARTRFAVARETYEKLQRGLLPEEIEAARARLRLAEAQKAQVEKYIADTYVTAPVDGTVTQKSVEEGDHVLPNAQLFRISRLATVNLMIYVSEVELARVKLGQKAEVFIDARPDRPIGGKVVYISPVAEFTPKNVQTKDDRTKLVFGVKLEIPNPDRLLKPGMPADARIAAEAQ